MPATRAPYTQSEVDRIRRLTETHGSTAAARIAGTCVETVANMRRRGWRARQKGQPIRQMPTDFAIQAAHLTIHQLVEHYGSSINTVQRWAASICRATMRGHRFETKTIPADLADRLRRSGTAGTARDHGVHADTVRKWRRQLQLDKAGRSIAPKVGWAERQAVVKDGRP